MSSSPIRTAVLGVGLAGMTFHIPFILALNSMFSLHAVLERNPSSSGGKVHERFGVSPKIYRSLEELLQDTDIELVVVGTPNETHYHFAKAALLAGKHVLVDKPITSTVEQAREIGQIAKDRNLVVYAFQNRRWDSDFVAVRSLLSSPDTIGPLTDFESHFDRYRPTLKGTWKDQNLAGAGQTFDLGAHLIDQALVLFGRPAKLTAFLSNMRGLGSPEVDDNFTIHLHYPADVHRPYPLTVTLRAHILSIRSKQLRYLARGDHGTYRKYGLDVQEDQLKLIKSPVDVFAEGFGLENEEAWGEVERPGPDGAVITSRWQQDAPGSIASLYKNLAGVIRNRDEADVKWEQATEVIEMIQLAHRSSQQGVTLEV